MDLTSKQQNRLKNVSDSLVVMRDLALIYGLPAVCSDMKYSIREIEYELDHGDVNLLFCAVRAAKRAMSKASKILCFYVARDLRETYLQRDDVPEVLTLYMKIVAKLL